MLVLDTAYMRMAAVAAVAVGVVYDDREELVDLGKE